MKLLLDMNLSPRWVALLTAEGWETIHWSMVGRANAPDSEIMHYAAARDYVVLSHDLDLSAILAATHAEKPSVVQIRAEDINPKAIGGLVIAALRHMTSELESGALVTVGPRHIRLRTLPLQTKD
jgi:predicted nuclease of predicted toxin-antitoxin system